MEERAPFERVGKLAACERARVDGSGEQRQRIVVATGAQALQRGDHVVLRRGGGVAREREQGQQADREASHHRFTL